MCAGRGKETDWVTGHFCTRLPGLGPIVNLVELLSPLPRWPRAYFTCIVFVFIYLSIVLFPFSPCKGYTMFHFVWFFSKDLSGGRHKYSALKIHTNQTISLCRLHILVSNRWNELTRQSLHTLFHHWRIWKQCPAWYTLCSTRTLYPDGYFLSKVYPALLQKTKKKKKRKKKPLAQNSFQRGFKCGAVPWAH